MFLEPYVLIVFLLFVLTERKFLIMFLSENIFESPEQFLLINILLQNELYQYVVSWTSQS